MANRVDLSIDRQTVLSHLRSYSVKVASPGQPPFNLASGGTSRLYIDSKRTCYSRTIHRPLAALLHHEVRALGYADAVAGVALGGCHLASLVAAYDAEGVYNLAYVRKAPKDHGTKNLVEHSWGRYGEWVILLEDVLSTGQSSANAVAALELAGFNVRGVVALIDRRLAPDREGVICGVPLRHVFGLEDLQLTDESLAELKGGSHEQGQRST